MSLYKTRLQSYRAEHYSPTLNTRINKHDTNIVSIFRFNNKSYTITVKQFQEELG
jgi:hypothetical protein